MSEKIKIPEKSIDKGEWEIKWISNEEKELAKEIHGKINKEGEGKDIVINKESGRSKETVEAKNESKLLDFFNNPDNLDTLRDNEALKKWAHENGWNVRITNDP